MLVIVLFLTFICVNNAYVHSTVPPLLSTIVTKYLPPAETVHQGKLQPLIGITASNLHTMTQFQLCAFNIQGTPVVITNLTTLGGIFAQTSAFIPDNDTLIFLSIGLDGKEYATIVSLNGTILFHQGYEGQMFSNVAYDIETKQYFINSYSTAESQNYIGELFPNTGMFILMIEIPGTVQTDMSAYCPIQHIFFLIIELDDGGNALVRVSTQNKEVLSSVVVEDRIEMLMWDYVSHTMYAWVVDVSFAGVLVILDVNTGKRVKTIVAFPTLSANRGTSVLDITSHTVYASLLDISYQDIYPVWVVVNTNTGEHRTNPTNPNLGYPITLAVLTG